MEYDEFAARYVWAYEAGGDKRLTALKGSVKGKLGSPVVEGENPKVDKFIEKWLHERFVTRSDFNKFKRELNKLE